MIAKKEIEPSQNWHWFAFKNSLNKKKNQSMNIWWMDLLTIDTNLTYVYVTFPF